MLVPPPHIYIWLDFYIYYNRSKLLLLFLLHGHLGNMVLSNMAKDFQGLVSLVQKGSDPRYACMSKSIFKTAFYLQSLKVS